MLGVGVSEGSRNDGEVSRALITQGFYKAFYHTKSNLNSLNSNEIV